MRAPIAMLLTLATVLAGRAGGAADCNGNGVSDDVDTEVVFLPHLVSSATAGVRTVIAADIDGDGDLDLASASVADQKIAWYENLDGAGTFGGQQVIGLAAGARGVFAADLDGDDDLDVLAATAAAVCWYENLDGAGTFGQRRLIDPFGAAWAAVHAADLDGDGDRDVLAGSIGSDVEFLSWYENVNGQGTFVLVDDLHQFTGYPNVSAADLDGDGDRDVLAATATGCYWFENFDGQGSFAGMLVGSGAFRDQFPVDVNGDGDVDVLAAQVSQVVAFQNLQNSGSFGPAQTVSTAVADTTSVSAGDLDGDGAPDALSASAGDDKIAWYRNVDGAGTFGAQQVISTLADGPRSPVAADLDGDGDRDVVAAAEAGNRVVWFENLSDDCNGNRVPDSCEPDCDANGIADACDLRDGTDVDCDGDSVPDRCQAACDRCDVDGDGCLDEVDGAPADGDSCADTDGDGCDDCSTGAFDPGQDGANSDSDGICDPADCDPGDNEVWRTSSAIDTLVLGMPFTIAKLSWQEPEDPGAVRVRYDTLRSDVASDFFGPAICLETDGTDRASTDGQTLPAWSVFYYLVRVENDCPSGVGQMGSGSGGMRRTGRSCD